MALGMGGGRALPAPVARRGKGTEGWRWEGGLGPGQLSGSGQGHLPCYHGDLFPWLPRSLQRTDREGEQAGREGTPAVTTPNLGSMSGPSERGDVEARLCGPHSIDPTPGCSKGTPSPSGREARKKAPLAAPQASSSSQSLFARKS